MMHNPPHPGEVLKDEVIAPLGLSVTEAAERFAMSRVALLCVPGTARPRSVVIWPLDSNRLM